MKFFQIQVTILFLFLLNTDINAQHEADIWYFGNYAGLDFSSGNPEPITDGALKNYEGCAVASDSSGSLLFYTNGITVWNKQHAIMENGYDLFGDTSSTQSAIVVPIPDNDSLYYIFTTDDLQNSKGKAYITDGFRYSVVNIFANNGLGRLTIKNVLLLDSVTEKLTAVKHTNNKDYWVVTHEFGTNSFFAWLINENGIILPPIESSLGSLIQTPETTLGHMKFSPDGSKLVQAIFFSFKFEILDFDQTTGVFSNLISIFFDFPKTTYGCEFSPDGSKLYMTTQYSVYQVDMDAGTEIDIQNSVTDIATFSLPVGALQLAKNGKLYITNEDSEYLSVIHNPNEIPVNCDFEADAVYLDGRIAQLGLPNFIQSYFEEPTIKASGTCLFDTTDFIIQNISNIDSVIWDFGDPASGSFNISRDMNPEHVFSTAGIFKVSLTLWYNDLDSYYSQNIKIVPLPALNLGVDTVFCLANSYELDVYDKHLSYLWNDMSTDSVLNINLSGKYWVDIKNIYTGCKNSDTINVIFSEIPEISLGNDTSFCENSFFILDAYHENYTYTWQDDSHNSTYTTYDEGDYFVLVANEFGCENADTINLIHELIPVFNFPQDTVICEGLIYELTTDLVNISYLWQDGSSESSFFVNLPGQYILQTQNRCGTWTDSIDVSFKFCGDIHIPNIFSPNSDGMNDFFFIRGIESEIWELIIYNRWGQAIISYDDYDNTWEGKNSLGSNLTDGAYFYVLKNAFSGILFKGTVRVIR